MSHVVNPILFRLKYSSFWSSVCVSNKKFLFFLDSKNVSVLEYLSKIVKRMYFFYRRYNIAYFKLMYRSRSINIYFMLKQLSAFRFKHQNVREDLTKLRLKRTSLIILFDSFWRFKDHPIKLKTQQMKPFVSNWFEFFNDDLYYDVNIKSRVKPWLKSFSRINIKLKKKIDVVVSYAGSVLEKRRKDEFLRVSLLSEKTRYTLKRFYSIRRYEKIYKNENLRWRCLTSLFKYFLPKFYNFFTSTLEKGFNKGSDVYDYKKFLENLFLNNNFKFKKPRILSKLYKDRLKKYFESNFRPSLHKKILRMKKEMRKKRKKKLEKKLEKKLWRKLRNKKKPIKRRFRDYSKRFVLRSTHNLSFLLNRKRRYRYNMVAYGKERFVMLNSFLTKSIKGLNLKNDDYHKKWNFNVFNAKESEYKPYKIWRLSNNYLKDIKSMNNDLRWVSNKNIRRGILLSEKELKKSKFKRIFYRKRSFLNKLVRGRKKIFKLPIINRISYYFRKLYFKSKREKKYLKSIRRPKCSKKFQIYEAENSYIGFVHAPSLQRFYLTQKSILKAYNTNWFYYYDEFFLYQRKKWETFKLGFKFYNLFEYKLPLQYLTFPYMEYYYEWIPLLNQFIYERQRRLFPSTSIWKHIRKRHNEENAKRHRLWEKEKYDNTKRVKHNQKFLYYVNFKAFLSQRRRLRKYWRRNKTFYRFLWRRKIFRKLKKRIGYNIRFKKHKTYKKFEYWLKQIQFLSTYRLYATILKKKIYFDLNLIFSFKINVNIYFFIKKPSKSTRVNAITVFNYIRKRIFFGIHLFKLFKYVMRRFKKFYYLNHIDGFAIRFTGRPSKRDRATYYWFKYGKFTKSTRISKIDHYYGKMILKYSTCSLKVSIMRNNYKHRLKKKREKLKKIKKIRKLFVIQ